MSLVPLPVLFITFAQALGMMTAPMVIFVGGFLGYAFAPTPMMATLPVASLVVGSALASMPAALIMRRIGRRKGFVYATLIALLGSILAIFSIRSGNFWGLCFSVVLLGVHMAFVAQFRFAALEWVKPERAATTASFVMIGGLLAAWVGPELAMTGKDLLAYQFSGSFVLLACSHGLLLVLLSLIPFAEIKAAEHTAAKRSLLEILKHPGITAAMVCAAVAYGVMSLIMTATPVSMSEIQDYPLEETKTVIQSHIMAMFLPSLFTPFILRYVSTATMLLTGLVAMVLAITTALMDQSYWGYWIALVFLGLGWNLLFAGGTALLAQSYRQEESFTVQAANEFTIFGVQAITSLSAGWLVFSYGWHVLNLFAIPLLMVALAMLYRWYRFKETS